MRKLGFVLLVGFGTEQESISGRLFLLNFRPVRAANLFEARTAFAEPGRSIGAVLIYSGLAFREEEARALREQAGDRPRFVVVGPRPGDVKIWKDAGVELGLFEPFVDSELRFVLNEATHDPAEWATRADPRVPTPLIARVHSATGTKAAIVYNLSISGAYLETPRPTASGGHVRLELSLPSGPLEIEAAVVTSNVPGNLQRPNLPTGMGVQFCDPAPEAKAALQAYVDERRLAYRL
jgi:PilZ domain